MDPMRIPPTNNLPGPSTARQVDPQQPVKQLQQEDQVQFSAAAGQVARLKSEMDVTVDRQQRRTVGRQGPVAEKKVADPETATGKDSCAETGNRLDVKG